MSLATEETITCSVCENSSRHVIYRSVNVTVDPHLLEPVLNGSLFQVQCPYCEHVATLPQMLYHDMRKKWLIQIYTPTDSGNPTIDPATAAMLKLMTDYSARIVEGSNDMIEKVVILENGLDDVSIEFAKLAICMQRQIDITSMFFLEKTTKSLFGVLKLHFIHYPTSSTYTSMEFEAKKILDPYQKFLPAIRLALKKRWGDWMLVTRSTVLDAMQTSGLAKRVG